MRSQTRSAIAAVALLAFAVPATYAQQPNADGSSNMAPHETSSAMSRPDKMAHADKMSHPDHMKPSAMAHPDSSGNMGMAHGEDAGAK